MKSFNEKCAVCNLPWEEHTIATDHHKLELECPTGDRVEVKWGLGNPTDNPS